MKASHKIRGHEFLTDSTWCYTCQRHVYWFPIVPTVLFGLLVLIAVVSWAGITASNSCH